VILRWRPKVGLQSLSPPLAARALFPRCRSSPRPVLSPGAVPKAEGARRLSAGLRRGSSTRRGAMENERGCF